ncbi:MAG: aminoglycoside N(3)-acetyltransferase [Thermomicrobiales bacterium]
MTDDKNAWWEQPSITTGMLIDDLRGLSLAEGSVVLVHSSLSQLGNVAGGADAVIDALLKVVGPTGTVLFPTLTGTERDSPDDPPVMDVRSTPCWTGRIPETARQRPYAVRSLHPTHSISALGAAADRYAAGHETGGTPCDQHSPYYRLIDEGGFILLLGGVSQESNTTLHCLEELAAVPYHLQPDVTDGVVIDADGDEHIVRNRLHLWQWEREFTKVNGPLAAAGALQSGIVGKSIAQLMSAKILADTILPMMREDPLYLLSDQSREIMHATSHV